MGTAANSTYMGLAAGLNCYGGVYVVTPAVNNPSEDYGINGYFESHLKGTQAGHVYGAGAWINLDAGWVDLAGGYFVTPLDVGIYEASATTVTNSLYVYGMRAEIVCTNHPTYSYMFSSNTNNNAITALFLAADSGKSIGYTAGGGSNPTAVGTIKFASLSSGSILYMHVYSTAT